jgi:hypothetical protein
LSRGVWRTDSTVARRPRAEPRLLLPGRRLLLLPAAAAAAAAAVMAASSMCMDEKSSSDSDSDCESCAASSVSRSASMRLISACSPPGASELTHMRHRGIRLLRIGHQGRATESGS